MSACFRTLADGRIQAIIFVQAYVLHSMTDRDGSEAGWPGTPHVVAVAANAAAVVRPSPRVYACWAGRQSYSWRGGGLVRRLTGRICLLEWDPPPTTSRASPDPSPQPARVGLHVAFSQRRTFY